MSFDQFNSFNPSFGLGSKGFDTFDPATPFWKAQVTTDQSNPFQSIHHTCIRTSLPYNKIDFVLSRIKCATAPSLKNTLSQHWSVFLFIAFQDIHFSSTTDPYVCTKILVLVSFALHHPTRGFCRLAGPILGLPWVWPFSSMIDINDNFNFDQQSPPLSLMEILRLLLPLSSCWSPYHDALPFLSPPLTSMVKVMPLDVLMFGILGRKPLPIYVWDTQRSPLEES